MFETFATKRTLERILVGVNSLVNNKVMLLYEPFTTMLAFESTLVSMISHVHHEIIFVFETFAAMRTSERIVVGVNSLMINEMTLAHKPLATMRALKRALKRTLGVSLQMPFKLILVDETLAAKRALEHAFVSVNQFVINKMMLLQEPFTAMFALEWTVVVVISLVN